MGEDRSFQLGALALCVALFSSACAATGAGVGVSGGSGPVRAGVGVRTDRSDTVLTSALFGAALGAVGGPIGLAVGAAIGAAYGVHEKGRQEKLAKVEMERQRQIDQDLKRQIEEQQRAQGQLPSGTSSLITQSETGLIVLEDHRAQELGGQKELSRGSNSSASLPSSETGLIVLEDHRADELKAVEKAAEKAVQAQIGWPLEGGKESSKALQSGSSLSREEMETKLKQLGAEIEAELAKQKAMLSKRQEAELPKPSSSGKGIVTPGLSQLSSGESVAAAAPSASPPSTEKVGEPDGFKSFYEGGRLARREKDLNGDGRPDLLLFYDAGGRLIRQEEDTKLSGRIDAWSYFEDERLARKEADTDGDGRVDFWAFYDGKGELIRSEADKDKDGKRDVTNYYEKGQLVREERFGGRERPQTVLFYEGGKPSRMEEDQDGDGRTDRVVFFDEKGRTIKEARDTLGRGQSSFWSYYDPESGAIVKQEEDLNGDGRADVITYYERGRIARREFLELDEASLRSSSVLLPAGGEQ